MELPALHLPDYPFRIEELNGKIHIFDEIRRKFLVLTPEEWVRQHVVKLLTEQLMYPKPLIRLEGGLTYNKLAKRSDILVLDRQGSPFLLVECKAPQVAISRATLEQASRYNKTVQARFLCLTNGLKTFCFEITQPHLPPVQVPTFPEFPK